MLIPHPAVLRRLVEEYETALAGEAERGGRASPRLQDLAYTLCVSTGTRNVGRALEAAHRLLAATPSNRPEAPEIGIR
ncbi:DUF5133 domain-containing protein [Streptomyces sp. TLI_185]|uniref:DUF5133 domain-containing protein n=1 Tax=Streptomyces sp. TLI_185 TaxID=2485151 RepID=UPI000F4FF8E0|nr:DUF5133 domain-containing protein [Streptomyces sp. TLI_185]RPF30680.1 uncharacterized protein DUF5133 [Streptomyces sp. TLI_185]